MKKSLLVLVALFTMILIPWKVMADASPRVIFGSEEQLKKDGFSTAIIEEYKCTEETTATQKITTCKLGILNKGTTEFKGGTVTFKLTPQVSSTTWEFKVNGANASEDTKARTENSVTLSMDPLASKDDVWIGTITWKANKTEEDCGGTIEAIWKGADATGGGSGEGDVVESGYAIPYVALAVGAVGVITVLATSKKKTKMYKI